MTDNLLCNDEDKYQKQLIKDFDKTKNDLDEYIDTMGKWADTQQHFPEKPGYHTLRFVILFNKFSVEKAKQKLDMYYTIRNLMPEYFRTNPFSKDMLFQNKVWHIVPLPKPTEDYERIIYHKLNPEYANPKYFDHDKVIIQLLHLMEYLIENDLCFRFHYICDCGAFKLGHATNANPMTLKKASVILEKVFSNRLTSFYMVNFPSFMETIVNTVFKPLLNPKLRKRLKVSTGTNILLDLFGKEGMPKDIGGEEKPVAELNDILMKKYQENKDRFLQLEKLGVKESLRPAKLKNDDVLGYYGNFKKLNVD